MSRCHLPDCPSNLNQFLRHTYSFLPIRQIEVNSERLLLLRTNAVWQSQPSNTFLHIRQDGPVITNACRGARHGRRRRRSTCSGKTVIIYSFSSGPRVRTGATSISEHVHHPSSDCRRATYTPHTYQHAPPLQRARAPSDGLAQLDPVSPRSTSATRTGTSSIRPLDCRRRLQLDHRASSPTITRSLPVLR